jgi:PncC family amidohydrolase
MTVATAESCTGGMISAALTSVAGSSAYFMGGVVAYDNSIKKRLLKVPAKILEKHGAVSSETAIAMARGVRKLMRADCSVSVTGIAGPGGGTKVKPVGLVYIGIAFGESALCFECRFSGSRETIRNKTSAAAIRFLADILHLNPGS